MANRKAVANCEPVGNRYKKGIFSICLDPTLGETENERQGIPDDVWYAQPFHTGPFTLNRDIFDLFKRKALAYCRFDDYNWDWSIVHMQSEGILPHTVLYPAHSLAKHVGLEGGMHHDNGKNAMNNGGKQPLLGPGFYELKTEFAGRRLYFEGEVETISHPVGYGGFAHPADQEHCMRLLQPTNNE